MVVHSALPDALTAAVDAVLGRRARHARMATATRSRRRAARPAGGRADRPVPVSRRRRGREATRRGSAARARRHLGRRHARRRAGCDESPATTARSWPGPDTRRAADRGKVARPAARPVIAGATATAGSSTAAPPRRPSARRDADVIVLRPARRARDRAGRAARSRSSPSTASRAPTRRDREVRSRSSTRHGRRLGTPEAQRRQRSWSSATAAPVDLLAPCAPSARSTTRRPDRPAGVLPSALGA